MLKMLTSHVALTILSQAMKWISMYDRLDAPDWCAKSSRQCQSLRHAQKRLKTRFKRRVAFSIRWLCKAGRKGECWSCMSEEVFHEYVSVLLEEDEYKKRMAFCKAPFFAKLALVAHERQALQGVAPDSVALPVDRPLLPIINDEDFLEQQPGIGGGRGEWHGCSHCAENHSKIPAWARGRIVCLTCSRRW